MTGFSLPVAPPHSPAGWTHPPRRYQAHLSEADLAAIDTICDERFPGSRSQVKQAWLNFASTYCAKHAVDGWKHEQARHFFREANAYLKRGPDGVLRKAYPSRTTLDRRWEALAEAGLIHVHVTGHIRLHITHVTLPGVLEDNGGFRAHADSRARRLASKRGFEAARRERLRSALQEPVQTVSSSGCRTPGGVHSNTLKLPESPNLLSECSSLNKRTEHKGTPRPTSYGSSAPPPSPKDAFPFPPQSHIVPNPSETEERRRTEVEPAEARLPLAPKTQPEPSNPALSHNPPVQPLALLRREAPTRPEPAVAAPNPQAPARPAETPKPTGYDGVRADTYSSKQADKAPQRDTQPPKDPAALNAWLAARGLAPIPVKAAPEPKAEAPLKGLIGQLVGQIAPPSAPRNEYVDQAERDTRRPWGYLGAAYDALCELKFREASESEVAAALHPAAFRAVLSVQPWPRWLTDPGSDVKLEWVEQAFAKYSDYARARRADLRLPDGPPRDPVQMVRFLEAATAPRAAGYGFDGQSMVRLRLTGPALLKAVDQADDAFQKGLVGRGKPFAGYLQAIATRLAGERSTG